MLFDGCCCHIHWRFIPKCNFSFMELYSNPNQVILNIFRLSCLNVLDLTSKCLEFSYMMFICSDIEVMPSCKDCIEKTAFLLTNPLKFTPSHLSKEKRCLSIQKRDSWFENSKLEKVFRLLILVLWFYFYNVLMSLELKCLSCTCLNWK